MLSAVAQAHHHTERLGPQPCLSVECNAVDVAVLDEQGGLYAQLSVQMLVHTATDTSTCKAKQDQGQRS